jgi:branched-chain amino acid transport system ATP-binding protein
MLQVKALRAGYGDVEVLYGIAFEIAAGEVVTLLGRNGMGKTTTVLSIMGIVRPTAGEIRFEGAAIQGLEPFRIAQRGLGLVPEGRQVFPNLTVRENLVATANSKARGACAWTLDSVLDLFPALVPRLGSMGRVLSGGEQQMLAIGRALMTNPRLLVLDEATEGLAPLIRAEIWRCLERVKQAGQSILLIDKNVKELTRIADRHYFFERGRIAFCCDSQTLRAQPDLQQQYLGVRGASRRPAHSSSLLR